jgi:hypothetical protein
MAGHLNTDAPAGDGEPYLAGYELRVAEPVEVPIAASGAASAP